MTLSFNHHLAYIIVHHSSWYTIGNMGEIAFLVMDGISKQLKLLYQNAVVLYSVSCAMSSCTNYV